MQVALSKLKEEQMVVPDLKSQQKIVEELNSIKKEKTMLVENSDLRLNAISQLPLSILNEVFGKYEITSGVTNE